MLDMMMIAQAFGIAGFIAGVFTHTRKNDEHLKLSMVGMFVLQSIHFLMMGSVNSAVASVINTIRTLISIKFNSKRLGAVFIALNIILGSVFATSWLHILPMLGAVIGTFSLFYVSGINMRIGFIIGALFWIVNNAIIGSIGGVMLECLVIVGNLITIYRIKLDKKSDITN